MPLFFLAFRFLATSGAARLFARWVSALGLRAGYPSRRRAHTQVAVLHTRWPRAFLSLSCTHWYTWWRPDMLRRAPFAFRHVWHTPRYPSHRCIHWCTNQCIFRFFRTRMPRHASPCLAMPFFARFRVFSCISISHVSPKALMRTLVHTPVYVSLSSFSLFSLFRQRSQRVLCRASARWRARVHRTLGPGVSFSLSFAFLAYTPRRAHSLVV